MKNIKRIAVLFMLASVVSILRQIDIGWNWMDFAGRVGTTFLVCAGAVVVHKVLKRKIDSESANVPEWERKWDEQERESELKHIAWCRAQGYDPRLKKVKSVLAGSNVVCMFSGIWIGGIFDVLDKHLATIPTEHMPYMWLAVSLVALAVLGVVVQTVVYGYEYFLCDGIPFVVKRT